MLVFNGVEAGAISIQDSTTPSFTDIIWSSTNKKFAAKVLMVSIIATGVLMIDIKEIRVNMSHVDYFL